MLKIVSWLLIILAMAWSWKLIKSEPVIASEIHQRIQLDLVDLIREFIKEKRPTITDLQFQKIYTESDGPSTIRATFKYTFNDNGLSDGESVSQVMEGQAILKRDEQSSADESVWSLEQVTIDKESVVFKNGLEIRKSEGQKPDDSNEEPRPAGPSSSEQQNG